MTVHLVTFSDESMSRARRLCSDSAFKCGVDSAMRYDDELLTDRRDWDVEWNGQRGFGYWRWKPMLIATQLDELNNGDTLIYADSGIEFIAPVSHIIDRMDQDIFLFGNNWEHAHWCKRDVLNALMPHSTQCPACHKWCGGVANRMPCEAGYYYHPTIGKQVQASVIFFRVSDYTRAFVGEWLKWCFFEGGRLIDDSPGRALNHPEFREHRHDQAILTTLAYREGIKLHYWPAQYNDGAFSYEKLPEYAGDNYPILFNHHRRRNHEWPIGARYIGHTSDGSGVPG